MPTPLEQFNEEVISEFCKIYTPVYLDLEASIAENLDVNLRNLITQKLTEHKELILGMVREKIFEDTNYDYKLWIESEKYRWHQGGRKELREEFLNNLDTI
jgi:hypothetical protein